HKHPGAAQLLAVEREFEFAGVEVAAGGTPTAAVPDHHGAAAVFALRDDAFEFAVLERVILDAHRQMLFAGRQAEPLRDSPTLEYAAEFEPQVVVECARGVFVDDVFTADFGARALRALRGLLALRGTSSRRARAGGLGRPFEIAFLSVRA